MFREDDSCRTPVLRVQLEGITHHVVHAFEDHMEEIKKYATAAIEGAMNTLLQGGLEKAIAASVVKATEEAIFDGVKEATEGAVKEYFSAGGEGMRIVFDAVFTALKKSK